MKRRKFITLLGGAAAWPLEARAQQRDRVRRVGVLMPFTADDQEGQARLLAFAQGLQQMGWAVGSNLRIDARWGAGDAERNRKYAAELLALAPDVILANGSPELRPFLQATHDLPIVFANVTDPVGQGFVASLPRPGGNITGFTSSEFGQSAKWLELLKEIAPRVTRAAVLLYRAVASPMAQLGAIQGVAPSFGVEVSSIDLQDAGEVEHARFVEHSVFVEDLIDRCASTHGVDLTEHVVEIAKQQGRCSLGHGFSPVIEWSRLAPRVVSLPCTIMSAIGGRPDMRR